MRRLHFLLLLSLFACTFLPQIANAQSPLIGINICGAEFGEKNLPGTLNVDYRYPTTTEISYFSRKGFKLLTLPFKWERIQHEPGGELDARELELIKAFIVNCSNYGMNVTLTMQNFAAYFKGRKEYTLGTARLSNKDFKDVWQKIAAALTGYNNIYGYDIMNEPRNIFGRHWRKAAQAAIDGIREADMNVNIIVDGENSSFTYDWQKDNNKLRKLKDPADKIIYDAHCYFDFDHSGRYDDKYINRINPNVGVECAEPFIAWLKKYKKKGIIGEFGVPANDSRWLEAMERFLAYITKKGIPANYWAAGEWWNDYPLSVHPQNGIDKPQMRILEKYLNTGKEAEVKR